MGEKIVNVENRSDFWKTMCGIDEGLLPFICGATISTALSTMLESSFKLERFLSGLCMFFVSAFLFWWYVCLSKTKREIAENAVVDKARFLTDKVVWENYYKPRAFKMSLLLILSIVFIVLWGIFLYFSYSTSIQTLCQDLVDIVDMI